MSLCSLSCVWLFVNLWTDYSPPSSSVHGILQARILEWIATSSSRGSSRPRDQTLVSWVACIAAAKSLQSCPTLCDPIDGSPPGSPIPGILQARTLEWVAISFSSAWKWSHSVRDSLPLSHQIVGVRWQTESFAFWNFLEGFFFP